MKTLNQKHKITRRLLVGLGAMNLALSTTLALAVHDINVFELEGNAVTNSPLNVLPDDWQTLYLGQGSATAFSGIVPDRNGDRIFTGGGSKTPNDVSDWRHKLGTPPDKNDITNAYAANYVHNGEQIVYFGADLFAQDGDAELAYWFFQNEITLNSDGTFSGLHENGDVYAAAKFSNGGTNAQIAVYEWDSTCSSPPFPNNPQAGQCAARNIRVVKPFGEAICNGSGSLDDVCAITNLGPETSPWPYTPKSGPAGTFPATAFFEGGINIFQLFGTSRCFASFVATTGASTSFTSTAKDFALGAFDVCAVDATKVCTNDDETDDTPTNITYNVRGCAINNGAGDINVTELLNSIAGGTQFVPGDLTWFSPPADFNPTADCDNDSALREVTENTGSVVNDPGTFDLAPGEALVYRFTEETDFNGVSDEVTISAVGTDGSAINAATAGATCPLAIFAAFLEVTKQCAADLEALGGNVVVRINVQGSVCNNGEVDLTNLQLTDDPSGVNLIPDDSSLAPGECTNYSGFYYPSTIPMGDTCPFADHVTATATAPANSEGEACVPVNGSLECTAISNTATCLLRAVDGDGDCSTGPLSPLP